jgi:hypothetical protein
MPSPYWPPADVKGFEARITRLKKLSEQAAAEQAQLAADREVHAREAAETKAALDRRQARLTGGRGRASASPQRVRSARGAQWGGHLG